MHTSSWQRERDVLWDEVRRSTVNHSGSCLRSPSPVSCRSSGIGTVQALQTLSETSHTYTHTHTCKHSYTVHRVTQSSETLHQSLWHFLPYCFYWYELHGLVRVISTGGWVLRGVWEWCGNDPTASPPEGHEECPANDSDTVWQF